MSEKSLDSSEIENDDEVSDKPDNLRTLWLTTIGFIALFTAFIMLSYIVDRNNDSKPNSGSVVTPTVSVEPTKEPTASPETEEPSVSPVPTPGSTDIPVIIGADFPDENIQPLIASWQANIPGNSSKELLLTLAELETVSQQTYAGLIDSFKNATFSSFSGKRSVDENTLVFDTVAEADGTVIKTVTVSYVEEQSKWVVDDFTVINEGNEESLRDGLTQLIEFVKLFGELPGS